MKKLLKITALCLGLLLFLLALLVFLIPYLVNLETIKQRLAQELSKKLNAQVELKEVDLSLLPQPGLRVRDLDLKSERYHFHLRQGVLVLALRPLLSRHIVVKKLVLTGPELSLFASAAKKAPGEKKPPSGDALEEIKKRLARVPPFSFEVEQGKLTYFRREKALFSFSDIDGTFAFKPSFWEWELTARSPAAKWIKSSGRLWLEERLGEGLLAVKHLDLARIVPLAERYPRAPLKSDLNLELSYRFEEGTLLLGFTATAPCLLKGKDKDHLFECSAILGQARFKPPYFRIELKEWVMKDPLIKTKGLILRDEQGYQMDFDVAEGDWADVRKRLLAFLGDKAGVRRLCEIIEKGRVSEFRLKAKAPRAKELFRLENLRLSGKAREVELKIPKPELHLTQVSGEMKLSGGLLEVEKAAARFKKTTLSAGSFKIHLRHLKDGTSPLLLRGRVKGVAEDVLLILERVSLPPSLRERLLRLKARGPLEGSVDLRGNLKKLSVAFEVAPRGVFLRYEGFPLPLTLLGGKILYRDRSLSLVGLHVATPRSILRSVNAKLDLGAKPPFLSLTEARGKISVPELTNFLLSFPSIAARLKGYDFRGQEAELLEASYNGPLNPKEVLDHLRFRLKTQALKVRLPVLPDVLDVKQGTVTYEDFALVIEPSQVALLDAEGLLNGKVTFRPFSLSLEGRASCGDGFLSWLFSRSRLPKDYFPTLPLEADPFSFRLKDGEIFFEGDLLCRGAPLHLKVEKDPKVLSLFLSSDELPLKLSLKKTKEVADFSFSGHIDDRGIRRYLRKNPFLIQEIEGDFRAHYVASDVLKSWFVGQVRLSRFRLPSKKYPFWIEALDLKAEKKRLFVRHLEMDLYGTSFEASGRVEISPRFLNVDGSVYTPTLLVEDLLNTLKKEQKKAGKSKGASSKLKIVAHLLVSAESIIYRNYEL
ncbi:MAG: AsmA family protein, partial [Thermodesulfobacteria bacterium]|nr:AsmA family protein [Thermodesulfobacteriota bacterium]